VLPARKGWQGFYVTLGSLHANIEQSLISQVIAEHGHTQAFGISKAVGHYVNGLYNIETQTRGWHVHPNGPKQ